MDASWDVCWYVCAACEERSPDLVSVYKEGMVAALLKAGWRPLWIANELRWVCSTCAQTPEESRVLAGLRRSR